MRNVFPPQMSIGQIGIADIQIDVSSRDDIPTILLGLQHIYTTPPLRDAVFKILEEVAPTKIDQRGEGRLHQKRPSGHGSMVDFGVRHFTLRLECGL